MTKGLDTVHDSGQLGVWTSDPGPRRGKQAWARSETALPPSANISMQRIHRHAADLRAQDERA